VTQVCLDRVRADEEGDGDLPVAQPLGDELGDVSLLRGERGAGGGTGSFIARMVLHISPPDENGDASIGGEWTILDGSGALTAAHGTGTTNGVNSGCAPIGSLFAMCQTGVSTVVASVN
jgi:hypothetical protein